VLRVGRLIRCVGDAVGRWTTTSSSASTSSTGCRSSSSSPSARCSSRSFAPPGGATTRTRAAGLTKPSVAAWAVNQVVRSQAKAARALWKAGDAVLDVQARVMAGEASGGDLRAAVDRERAALGPLTDAARGLVTGNGRFLGDPNVQS
jgi:hypothetical protein